MDFRLVFTDKALTEIEGIISHIAIDDADAAIRFGSAILDHMDLLKRFPQIGASIKKRAAVRMMIHSPILVYYRVHEKQQIIEILHFRHGARKPPKSADFK